MKRYNVLYVVIILTAIITVVSCSPHLEYYKASDPNAAAGSPGIQQSPGHSGTPDPSLEAVEPADTLPSQPSAEPQSPQAELSPSSEEHEPFSDLPPPINGKRYTDDEITSIFENEGHHVIEIRNFSNTTVVQYTIPETYDRENGYYRWSSFVWFDRFSGERKMICPAIDAMDFDVRLNHEVWILTRGIVNGTQYFPGVFYSVYGEYDGLDYFRNTYEEYFMPTDRSITIGVLRREALTEIIFGVDEVAFTFTWQPGYEGDFFAGSSTIPEMNFAFEDGKCVITMYKTILAEDFIMPEVGEGNSMRSFLYAECDGTDTVVTLKIADDVDRYNVTATDTPDEYFPCALLKLSTTHFNRYPSGW